MAESEFGGWAKLTCQDAAELAQIVGTFSRRTVEERTRMLLVLFASQSRDGTVNIGYRTLAERADVSNGKAQRFMDMLKSEGVLVDVGETVNNGGRYTVRAFDWVQEGASKNRCTPDSENKEKPMHPRSKKPAKSESHHGYHKISEGAAVGRLAPAAASQDTDDDDYSYILADIERLKKKRMGGGSNGANL